MSTFARGDRVRATKSSIIAPEGTDAIVKHVYDYGLWTIDVIWADRPHDICPVAEHEIEKVTE